MDRLNLRASRIGEFKLTCKKRGFTGTELVLLTRSGQLNQKLLELVPAAARQMLDACAAILRPPARAPAVLTIKKRKREVKDKRKAKFPNSDSDSTSDNESEESNVEEQFSYEDVGEEGDAGINTDPNVTVMFGDVFHVSGRAAEAFAVSKFKGLTTLKSISMRVSMAARLEKRWPVTVNTRAG
jgi:hypothetical protein